MRKILFSFLVSLLVITLTHAQQVTHFAYIQTDNKQPFYIKWNNKVWSSSSTGYLILSKIKEQQINIVVGFPKNIYPEQSFVLSFNRNKDAGFLLKDFADKGWGLYNLQSFAVTYAAKETTTVKEEIVAVPVTNQPKQEETKSPFGDLLVQVTQDSTVKNITVEKPQPPVVKKEEPVKPKMDSVQKTTAKPDDKPIVGTVQKETKPDVKNTTGNDKKVDSLKAVVKNEEKPVVAEQKKEDKPVVKDMQKETIPVVKTTVADSNSKISPVAEVKTEEKKPVVTQPVKDEKVVVQEPVVKPQAEIPAVKSTINLFATNENAESYDYIYVTEDKTGSKDTVGISIQKEKVEIKPVINAESKDINKEQQKPEPKFIEIIADTSKKENEPVIMEPLKKNTLAKVADTISKDPAKNEVEQEKQQETKVVKGGKDTKELPKETAKVVMVNTDCKSMATEKDFMTLRKKMVSEDNDDDMVSAARKVFKTKCFTADQVKNLCVLFLKDEGKYKFLDAAYPYVYDTDNFKLLSSLLTEDYYVNRFKAMIKN